MRFENLTKLVMLFAELSRQRHKTKDHIGVVNINDNDRDGARAEHCGARVYLGTTIVSAADHAAMTSVATTTSDASITLTPELVGEATSLKQLQALLKSVDPRGFEHVTKKQALTALIYHLIEQAKSAGSTAAPSSAGPPSTALPTSPASSLARTVSSPGHKTQRPTPQPSITDQDRWEEHDRKLEELDHRLEEFDRRSRKLNLIIFNLPEEREDPLTDVWEMIDEKHRREMCVNEMPQRMGRRSSDNTRSRPVRVKFGTLRGKHLFLKYAKVLRQAGCRIDDDLTRLQQDERKSADADFKILKSKGYNPFFRGSQLLYFHSDKMHRCKKGKAKSTMKACDLEAMERMFTAMQEMADQTIERLKEDLSETVNIVKTFKQTSEHS